MHINVQNNNNILEDLKICFYMQLKYVIIVCVFGITVTELFKFQKEKDKNFS